MATGSGSMKGDNTYFEKYIYYFTSLKYYLYLTLDNRQNVKIPIILSMRAFNVR